MSASHHLNQWLLFVNWTLKQCWKLPQVRWSKGDNFGGDSWHKDLKLFLLSFKHCPHEQTSLKFKSKYNHFSSKICIWKCFCRMSAICSGVNVLTHWGWVMHICIRKLGHHWLVLWPGQGRIQNIRVRVPENQYSSTMFLAEWHKVSYPSY